ENRLDDAARAELRAALVASPEACRLFWDFAHQHAMLAELVAEGRGRRLAHEERVRAATLTLAPKPKQRRLPWRALASAAAILLVLAGSWWLLTRRGPPETENGFARLAELRGEVFVIIDNQRRRAKSGDLLRPGQEVRTGGAGSFAAVIYSDS